MYLKKKGTVPPKVPIININLPLRDGLSNLGANVMESTVVTHIAKVEKSTFWNITPISADFFLTVKRRVDRVNYLLMISILGETHFPILIDEGKTH